MSETPRIVKVTPDSGTRRFRRSCSVAVVDGELVATDRKGRMQRYPLNQGPESPVTKAMIAARPIGAFRSQLVILDGNGEVLVRGYVGDWDPTEWDELEQAAGLVQDVEYHAEPKTRLRQDGLVLEDSKWWRWVPQVGSLTFVIAMVGGVGGTPGALAWIVVLSLVAYIVAAFASGGYGRGRRGKGAAVEEALMAGDEKAWGDLIRNVAGPLPDDVVKRLAAGDEKAWDKLIREAEAKEQGQKPDVSDADA